MGRFPVDEMNVVKIILITNTSHPKAKDVTVWLLPLTDLILREANEDITRVYESPVGHCVDPLWLCLKAELR